MAIKYTNLFDIYKEVDAYVALRLGNQLNLGHFRRIAQNRWSWIAQNWLILKEQFLSVINGEDSGMTSLESLEREVTSYKLGNVSSNPLESQDKYQEFNKFIDLISLSSLSLTPDENIFRDKEIERISTLEIESFKQMRTFLRQYQAIYAGEIGLGDPDAEKVTQISSQTKKRSATIDDIDHLAQVENLMGVIESIILDQMQTRKRPPNLLAISNNNLSGESSISVANNYLSFQSVPFEISLEHMAKIYLGTKDLWYELATVNNLKPPFIDESGTKISISAPPAINNLIIPDTKKDEIFVGTKIGIGSYRHKEEKRIVEKVILNENGTMVLFLAGNQDINKFLPTNGAYVRVYKPGTTRNGNYVIIPSSNPAPKAGSSITPTSGELRNIEKAFLDFGVDITTDQRTSDFIIDSNGNFKYCYGLNNVRQSVLNAIRTTQGELPFHPRYGVNANIGDRFYGTADEASIFGEVLIGTLMRDSRYSDIKISKISTTGNGMSLQLIVYLQGLNTPLALSFVS